VTFSNDFSQQEKDCALAAVAEWQVAIQDNYTFANVYMDIGNDIPGALAGTQVYLSGGFYIPPIPPWAYGVEMHIELTQTYLSQISFDTSSVASGLFDGLSIFRHELGHALGFSSWYESFADNLVAQSDGSRLYEHGGLSVGITPDNQGTHMADANYPDDLMNAGLPTGVRRPISQIDLEILSDAYGYTGLTTLFGDANKDGKVSFADYLILEQNFGKTGATWAMGDFNNDGKVNFADYLLLERDFGKSVPEPATLSLLALGGLAMLRRRFLDGLTVRQ
jgi:hypothetical protein